MNLLFFVACIPIIWLIISLGKIKIPGHKACPIAFLITFLIVIMTRMPNIICANENDNAYDLAKKIIEHEIDSIPVVKSYMNNEGKNIIQIIGKVSKTNITKLFVKLGEVNK